MAREDVARFRPRRPVCPLPKQGTRSGSVFVDAIMLDYRSFALLLIALCPVACKKSSSRSAPPGSPAAPSNLRSTLEGLVRLTLTWTDNSTDEDLFQIRRRVGNGEWGVFDTTPADTTSWQTTLSFSTDYRFAVSASNANGDSLWTNQVTLGIGDRPTSGGCGVIYVPSGELPAASPDTLFLVDGVLGSEGVCEGHALSATTPSFVLDADRQGAVRARVVATPWAAPGAAQVITIGLTLIPYAPGQRPDTVDTYLAVHDGGTAAFTAHYGALGLSAWRTYTPPWLPAEGVPLLVAKEYLLVIETDAATRRWNAWLDGLPLAVGLSFDDIIRVRALSPR